MKIDLYSYRKIGFFGVLVQPLSLPLVRICFRFGIHPNAVSISNILGPPLLFLLSFFMGYYKISGFFVLLAVLIDFIDGKLARLSKKQSSIGAVLDALSDIALWVATRVGVGLVLFPSWTLIYFAIYILDLYSRFLEAKYFPAITGAQAAANQEQPPSRAADQYGVLKFLLKTVSLGFNVIDSNIVLGLILMTGQVDHLKYWVGYEFIRVTFHTILTIAFLFWRGLRA